VISGNAVYGVLIGTFGPPNTAAAVVEGDYIGTDVTGNVALGNAIGIQIENTTNTTIGGTAAGAGNVIAGNVGGGFFGGSQVIIDNAALNLVQGNLIGLDASSQAFAGATNAGVLINHSNASTIGGTTAAARNVISGNANGVNIEAGTANVVEGNDIGTDTTGTSAIGNGAGGTGVVLGNSTNNTVGGTSAAARNVISGNAGNGVESSTRRRATTSSKATSSART
jgi:hypothetical protein